MKKFFLNIALFLFFIILIGEVVVRITHAVSDVPKRTIDADGIQKYVPNQEGYWKGGAHKWTINELGWPGQLPENYNNLIMVIGDSFIENFMNPNECHQAAFLKKRMTNYNFMELGRSGVSLIEAMEISKQMDTLKPIQSLIYVNSNDFDESVREIKPMRDITQLRLKDQTILYGEMKAPGLKKILYNWKLLYYFYNRFPLNLDSQKAENPIKHNVDDNSLKSKKEVVKLIKYISANYNINDKTLVFHPNSDQVIIEECENIGFNIIELDSKNDKPWTFDYDTHWTCYGHKKVAGQVSAALLNGLLVQKDKEKISQ